MRFICIQRGLRESEKADPEISSTSEILTRNPLPLTFPFPSCPAIPVSFPFSPL